MNLRAIVLSFGTFAVGTGALVMIGVLPAIAEEFDTTEAVAGLGVTAYSLSYAVFAPLLPALFAGLDRRKVLAFSLVTFVVGNLATAAAPHLTAFLVARALVGVSAAAFTPQALAMAVTLAPPALRGRAITTVLLGTTGAIATGVPIGTLLGNSFGFRVTFIFVAAVGLVALAGLVAGLRGAHPLQALGLRKQFAPLRQPAVLVLVATSWLITTGFFAISTYFAPLFAATAGVTPEDLAIVLFAFGAASVASMLAAGRLLDRFGGFHVISVSLFCLIVFSLLLIVTPDLTWAVVIVALWALVGTLTFPAQQYELSRLAPDNPTAVFALNSSAVFLGSAFGGILGSTAISVASTEMLVVVATLPMFLALVISIVQARRSRPPRV